MLKRASIFIVAFLALVGFADAKDRKPNHLGPIYVNPKPVRDIAVIERPTFVRPIREGSTRERAYFDKTEKLKHQRVQPQFEAAQQVHPQWDKTVMETKWEAEEQPLLEEFPQERKTRKIAGRHAVRRGVRIR